MMSQGTGTDEGRYCCWPCAGRPAWPAIDASDVRDYGEVFAISARAVSHDRVEVSWRIADNHYLYNNRFLEFSTDTPGVVLGAPDIPKGLEKFDELLMEDVIMFYDELPSACRWRWCRPASPSSVSRRARKVAWKVCCVTRQPGKR